MIDVTNSPKDVHDFWYNSPDNYNELVDHLVSTMPSMTNNERPPFVPKKVSTKEGNYSAPFDTEAYANYKALVDKEKEQIDPNNLTESIYKLGYRIDTLLTKLISQLDTIIEEESDDIK